MANNGLLSGINHMLQYVINEDRDMYSLSSKLCNEYSMNYVHFTLSMLADYRKFLFKTNKKKSIGIGYVRHVLDMDSNFKKFELVSENYYIVTRDSLLANGHTIDTIPEYMLTAREVRDKHESMVGESYGVGAPEIESIREFVS